MRSVRTLSIAVTLPYPPLNGRDLRNWENICGLSNIGRVGVFGLSPANYIDAIPPTTVEFWRRPTDPYLSQKELMAARAWPLDPTGHPSSVYSEGVAREIKGIIAKFDPQVVVIEGLWLYRYIEVVKQFDVPVVLDCHNVEAALYQEFANNSHGDDLPARLVREVLPARTRLIEQKAVASVDQIWVCSEEDAALMKRLHGTSTPIHVVSNGVNVDSYAGAAGRCRHSVPSTHQGKTLIFPAAFKWEPNTVAASFLIHEFFPRLAKVFPDCQLLLAGREPSAEMINAAERDARIVVTGEVSDIRPYLAAAKAMVVPLFQGGGTRFKILEAFAAGVPVISTAKGAEGLAVENGKHLLFAETADEFVAAVGRLWTDTNLGNRLAAHGLELVTESYSLPAVIQQIAQAVYQLVRPLDHPKTALAIPPDR
jgi:glycosyltransferase involved in cell wall biosynthesis